MSILQRKYAFIFVLILGLCTVFQAQRKSDDIRVVDGKKFYFHKAEKKQSLYAISKLYNVSIDEIMKYNPDLKQGLKAGNEIKIPFAVAIATPTNTAQPAIDTLKYIVHRVEKKETLYSMCRQFNISEKQLRDWNPSLADGLKEGQALIVGEKGKPKSNPKKKNDPKQSEQPKVPVKEQKPVVKEDTTNLHPVSKERKTAYNIGLMLPFNLEASVNTDVTELARTGADFPSVPALALDFYLGFKRAADSLKDANFDPNIVVQDVDDADSLKPVKVASDPSFTNLDMIFGPFYASDFKIVSKKASENFIPIVSPITQQNKILHNNIYVSKTNPSQYTLLESLADYLADSLVNSTSRLILVAFDKDKRESQFVQSFRKYYNDREKKAGRPMRDTVMLVKGIAGVKAACMPGIRNIVVLLSSNQVYIADFTTQLATYASEKMDIVLCGWESVSEIGNIDQEYLNQLHFTFPSQFNVSAIDSMHLLTNEYKALMNGSPGEQFFVGFDIGMYYLKNLKEQGPAFIHQLDTLPAEGNFVRFKFARPDRLTGFDNRGAYIFTYHNYQLRRTGWK